MRDARARSAALAVLVLATVLPAAEKPAATKPAAKTSEVRGRVLGPATEQAPQGAPVAKARVAVAVTDPLVAQRAGEAFPPATGETGPDGTFAVSGLPGTSFTVRVQAPGLAPFEVQDVGPGASLQVRLKPGQSLTGRVVDATARKPVAGVTVLARTRASRAMPDGMLPQTVTDAEGRFELADLAPGVVDVEARGAAWARATEEGVAVPQRGALELAVRPGGRLAGKVVDADGRPVEGASVRLEPAAIERLRDVMLRYRPVRTDAKGAFAFDGLQAGDAYRLSAAKKGLSRASAGPFTIQSGTVKEDVVLELDPSAGVRVRLLDPDGKPISLLQAAVHAEPGGRGPGRGSDDVPEEQIVSEGDGRFRIGGLTTGTVTLELLPDGFAPIERKDFKLEAGKTVDLGTLTTREGRTLRGRIVDEAGAPVEGATIRGFWMGEGRFRNRQVRSGGDGRFRMAGVGEGQLQAVIVSAKGYASETRNGVSADDVVEITLQRAGTIVGRVIVDETGEPVPAKVEAQPEAKAEMMSGMRFAFGFEEDDYADASGNFRVDDLEPGKYTLIATAPNKAPVRETGIEVRADDVADAGTLRIKEGLTLRGRVLDAKDDSPVPGAAVTVGEPQGFGMRFGMGGDGRATMSDAAGAFQTAGLEAKTYEVSVSHPDFARAVARADMKDGDVTPEVVVRVSRGGTLTGAVRDAQGSPVPAASIVVMQGMGGSPQSATTGEDGIYRMERLSPGSYRAMRVPDANRLVIGPGMKSAEIREGETTVLDFDDAARITVTGRVLRGGQPVGDSVLVFLPGEAIEMKTTQSESDGRFQIGLDRAGAYNVVVQSMSDHGSRSSATIQVPDQPQVSQDIVLSGGGIAGTVTGPDGEPVEAAVVQASPDPPSAQQGPRGSGAQTRADGTYAIDGLQPGTYKVRAMAPGKRPAEATARVGDETGIVRVDLRLETGRSVRGRLVDGQGNGLQGAFVMAAPAGAGDQGAGMSGTTDVNGGFEIMAPAEGSLDVTAVKPGYAPARASGVTATEGEDGPGILLRATSGGRIRIEVVSPEGTPRQGVQPLVRAQPAFLGSAMASFSQPPRPSDATGISMADLLSPASYVVSVAGRSDVSPVTVEVPADGSEAAARLVVP